MASTPNISAAPVLFKLGEQEFLMSPLTDRDIQELNNFIKQNILAAAREFCKSENNINMINAVMKAAMEQVSKVDWILNSDLLESVERIAYLLWLGVRNNPPKPSRSDFMQTLMQDWNENFKICMDTLQLINPFLLKRVAPEKEDQVPI